MAGKRRKPSKKVTIEIDVETLQALIDAAAALSELANGVIFFSEDPAARAIKPRKRARKSPKKRR